MRMDASQLPSGRDALPYFPRSRYAVFFGLAIAGCTADLLTKHWCFSTPALRAGNICWLWTGHVGIQLSLNEGALFGMGQGNVRLFAAFAFLAAIGIPVWLFLFRAARDGWLTAALGCVMAGVLGNLHDRLGLHHEIWPEGSPRAGQPVYAVRDWVLWQLNDQWVWPNFNIADSLLVIGACLLFLHAVACKRGQDSFSQN
ncbi:MAG: signal peptidase II [Pirellulales bacterium]|nr:signal peptidase II [Pirellulales bacterium]